MRSKLYLILPVSLASYSCETAQPPLSTIATQDSTSSAPAAVSPEAPALDPMLDLIRKDRRQFEALRPGVMQAHIAGVMRAELSADGLVA